MLDSLVLLVLARVRLTYRLPLCCVADLQDPSVSKEPFSENEKVCVAPVHLFEHLLAHAHGLAWGCGYEQCGVELE